MKKAYLTMENKIKYTENEWMKLALEAVLVKMEWVADQVKSSIPYTTKDKKFDDRSDVTVNWGPESGIDWWTNGFWAGTLWQLFYLTKEEKYRRYANEVENKLDQCFVNFTGLHHDVGFMWTMSACYQYKLTGNKDSLTRALHAANILAGRFNVNGNFIRAWNRNDQYDCTGWAIIDCMMNLSILYWASEQTKDNRFAAIAKLHAKTVQRDFIRDDGSVKHIVEYNPDTGEYIRSYGGQGYARGSAWSRGQAWAVYGFTISYEHTKLEEFRNTAEKVADFCCQHITKKGLVKCDFFQPRESDIEDSCGAVILASGLLQLSAYTSLEKAQKYQDCGIRILKRITNERADFTRENEAIVEYCTAAYKDNTHHINMSYADYFYIEAILKLSQRGIYIW